MFRDPLNINHGVLWLLLLLVCWAPTERGNERERERKREKITDEVPGCRVGSCTGIRGRAEGWRSPRPKLYLGNLVDSASSHTLVSKIKPCMSKYKRLIR